MAMTGAADTPDLTVHASAVVIGASGILIRGPSGAGKSNLAYALIDMAVQRQIFGRLIGDDRIELTRSDGELIARGHPQIQGRLELRGLGIITLPYEAAAVLRMIIDLVPAETVARYPEPSDRESEVCGVKLPRLALPIGRSSYDCALLTFAAMSHAETI